METRSEHYTIMFLAHLDQDAFQGVADNGMFIRNHNFHRLAKLVVLIVIRWLPVLCGNFSLILASFKAMTSI